MQYPETPFSRAAAGHQHHGGDQGTQARGPRIGARAAASR
jgi:hypothetical protein